MKIGKFIIIYLVCLVLVFLFINECTGQCYEHTEQVHEDEIRFVTSDRYKAYLFILFVDTSRATISNLEYSKAVDSRIVFQEEKPYAVATITESRILVDATGIKMVTDTTRKPRFCTAFNGDRFMMIISSMPISQKDFIDFVMTCIPDAHSIVQRNEGENCVLVIRGNSTYADGPSEKPPEAKNYIIIRKL